MIATDQAQREARRERARQVLMQLALPFGGGLLLRVKVAVVDLLDLGGDLHDGVAPRHDLAAQKAVPIDHAVVPSNSGAYALQYSSSWRRSLSELSGSRLAQQRLELAISLSLSVW